MDTSKELTAALFKAKFLAKKIGSLEFQHWVESELNGYQIMPGDDNHIPKYRKHYAIPKVVYKVGLTVNEAVVPLEGLDEQVAEWCRQIVLHESVASLEMKSKNSHSEGTISYHIPPEGCYLIQQHIRKSNRYVEVISGQKIASVGVVFQTLTAIRSKFLDFMMEVDSQFGNVTDPNDLATKKDQITTIMNTTIHNTGDGALINTGNDVKIKNKIRVTKQNFEQLARVLSENNVHQEDIRELQQVIDTDNPDESNKLFGTKVNAWILKMVGKSLSGTWMIGAGAAGDLLADIISNYYGW
jgi:hypothetical protein